MANGKPFAAIIGRWRRLEEEALSSSTIEELLVVKVTANGGCEVATVGALSPGALVAAREIADTRAGSFRCGIDKPALNGNAANGSVRLLDDHFGEHETLEHNGSLVELSHFPSGAVEIRYRQPKPSLKVEVGTLLSRGQERAGQITGSAFLFKAGCKPAEYNVTGRRTDGVLVLEGNAPRREPGSCAASAASNVPKPSRLAFSMNRSRKRRRPNRSDAPSPHAGNANSQPSRRSTASAPNMPTSPPRSGARTCAATACSR